jgi:hypothetical protein
MRRGVWLTPEIWGNQFRVTHIFDLKGKVFEAKGDFNRALDAYEEALAEYVKKSARHEPPPPVFIRSIVRMQDKLGMKEAKESKN